MPAAGRAARPATQTITVLCRPGGPGGGIKPDPIPNSTVKPLSAHGTKPQGLGESVAARPAKHRIISRPLSGRRHTRLFSFRAKKAKSLVKEHFAGWSSPVARQAHNLKVAGSNPAPATTFTEQAVLSSRAAFFDVRLVAPSSTMRAISPTSSISRPLPVDTTTTRSTKPCRICIASSRIDGSRGAACSAWIFRR